MRGKGTLKALATLSLASLALAGCNPPSESDEPPPPTDTELPEPTDTPISILRESPEPAIDDIVPMEPLEATVSFPEGGLKLDDKATEALDEIVKSEQFLAGGPIILRGHTDSVGHDEANLRASRKRAEVIANFLEEAGASRENIEVIPLGEQRPVAPNAKLDGTPDEEGRATNRRVEIVIQPPESMEEEPDETGSDTPEPAAPPSPSPSE